MEGFFRLRPAAFRLENMHEFMWLFDVLELRAADHVGLAGKHPHVADENLFNGMRGEFRPGIVDQEERQAIGTACGQS